MDLLNDLTDSTSLLNINIKSVDMSGKDGVATWRDRGTGQTIESQAFVWNDGGINKVMVPRVPGDKPKLGLNLEPMADGGFKELDVSTVDNFVMKSPTSSEDMLFKPQQAFLVEKEMQFLDKVMRSPRRPLTLILGGAKIDSKLLLIRTFLEKADTILIGGGMSFTFLKARGKEVGGSLVDKTMVSTAKDIINQARSKSVRLVLPEDVICGKNLDDTTPKGPFTVSSIPGDLMGLDIGPKTITKFIDELNKSRTVIWNGPLGVFEVQGYHVGSYKIARHLAGFNEAGSIAIIGGGDTAAAVNKFKLTDKIA